MTVSVFELFKIGIGPSSSHTVGPMRAVHRFLLELETEKLFDRVARVRAALYGSLAFTGKGHATDTAVILGLLGETPDNVDPDDIDGMLRKVRESGRLRLGGRHEISFDEATDLPFIYENLDAHPNGISLKAYDAADVELHVGRYYSVGGGFVMREDEIADPLHAGPPSNVQLPHPFRSAVDLLAIGRDTGLGIADIARANERVWRSDAEIDDGLRALHTAMTASVERGMRETGELPGGLKVKRRAASLRAAVEARGESGAEDPLAALDWVNLYALAVNEENAAGGRVVTAPTNGAAGVIPAVLTYYERFISEADDAGVFTFLLTAAAIGALYKMNASISAAEVGCQGEVGVACSMAAGALAAALGGTNAQIEQAAEIGMEHNLGLTCDPIGGLVQIPCIERNTMGAVKAINAARLALAGDGSHMVSLDQVIETMRQTGHDMQSKYKETAQGGLAVNWVAC